MLNLGVLISGRGTNLQAILDACAAGTCAAQVAVVLSNVADAYGLERARRAGVPAVCVPARKGERREEYDARLLEVLQAHEVDLVCLAGYMRILGKRLLAAYPQRILNIHPSLLPAFPGLEAQRAALEHGAKVSGCTVHFVDEGVDTGPIILQAAVPVYDEDDAETLAARILEREHEIYPRAIQLVAENRLRRQGRRVLGGQPGPVSPSMAVKEG
ncbi:MAG: phosphoribosylglycinamide formyltransferase [Candidatus Tectomicrobia bacterium]|nr:phosphoribosylglycinamide formyltransferase [Candidatus Tectomicrobia bacterium]